jgi:Family of unknown function (DUF6510)
MTELHTDGNDVAGTLGELLAADPTTTLRRCQSCGAERPLGEHRAYRGAGIALRCPACEDVAVLIGDCAGELVIRWYGTFRVPRAA